MITSGVWSYIQLCVLLLLTSAVLSLDIIPDAPGPSDIEKEINRVDTFYDEIDVGDSIAPSEADKEDSVQHNKQDKNNYHPIPVHNTDRTKHDIILTGELDKKQRVLSAFKLSPAEITKFKIWPEAKIQYYIDDFSYDKFLRDKIRVYLEHAETLTGLNFVQIAQPPQDENERWVFFVNRRGQLHCKDYSTKSFTNTGVQKVIVGYDCLQNQGPMATIVLALAGVPPQHNSPDRDRFIHVSIKSILPEKRGLFKRLKDEDWLFHDLPYDYYSIGHYSSFKYTADGSATITAVSKENIHGLGSDHFPSNHSKSRVFYMKHDEKDTYSKIDIQKIKLLYNNILQSLPQIDPGICQSLYRARHSKLWNYIPPLLNGTLGKQDKILGDSVNSNTGRPKMYAILSSIETLNELYRPGKDNTRVGWSNPINRYNNSLK